MKLKKLQLEQFRNYPNLELNFDTGQNITYIIGQNAQGKTNILEAIYLLALTKSFRTSQLQDLIQWGSDYGRIKGDFDLEEGGEEQSPGTNKESHFPSRGRQREAVSLELFLGNPPHPKKSHKKNSVKISTENFIGTCKVIFFHPEDLNMLYLGPDLRRRYLDVLNLQINKKYYRALRTYRQIIKQRNALIKEIKSGFASRSDIQVWNEQMVEQGSFIILERAKTVQFINEHLQNLYQSIAQRDDKVVAHYRCAIDSTHGEGVDFSDQELVQKHFENAIRKAEIIDFHAEVTTIGPHRDDVEFTLNDRKLSAHASRGEYRSLILALKLLELKFFEKRTKEKPLLLLDDVFSELDFERQKMLLRAATEGSQQTIITSTHLDGDFTENRQHAGLKNSYNFLIKEGYAKRV